MSEQWVTHNAQGSKPAQHGDDRHGLASWLKQMNQDANGEDDDLAHGQVVIVAARWILVAAGLVLALWNPAAIGPLRLQVLVLLLIAVANFFLHSQLLRNRGTVSDSAYLASAADLGVITLLAASQGGFESNLFVFYFPAILALSVAFRARLTAAYGGAAMACYALICLESLGFTPTSAEVQTLLIRLLMIAGVAVCGALFQQVERDRRDGENGPDRLGDDVRAA